MPLFDSLAVLVTAGAVVASASSLFAVIRGPTPSYYEQCRRTRSESGPAALDTSRTSLNTDAKTPNSEAFVAQKPLLARLKPVLARTGRLCYRTVVTFLPAFTAIGAAWLLLESPETFTRAIPAWCASYGARVADVVPLHPNNVLESFDLGVAAQMLASGQVEAALQQAAAVAGRAVSEEELTAARRLIEEMVGHRSVADRVWASLTLVNTMWLISACGLAWVGGPFLAVVLRPLIRRIPWKAIAAFLRRAAIRCSPLVEPSLFVASFALAVESARYVGTDTMVGAVLAFSGALLFNMGIVTSLERATHRWGSSGMRRAVTSCWYLFNAAYVAPLAILHQSTLLGYATMGNLTGAMGLLAGAYPGLIVIGFRTRRELLGVAVGCGSLTWVYVLMTAMQVHPAALAPFESAVGVIGTTGYLLALDINALIARSVGSYTLYGINVGLYFAVGELLGLEGMSNVAKTFTGIGLFTLYCGHFPSHRHDAATVWLFFLFASLYGSAMYLNRNPQLIASLFGGAPFLRKADHPAVPLSV